MSTSQPSPPPHSLHRPVCPAGPAAGAGPMGPAPVAALPLPEVGSGDGHTGRRGVLTELPGCTEASRIAQVRARAAGIVQRGALRRGAATSGRPAAVPHRRRALPRHARRRAGHAGACRGQPAADARPGRALQAAGRGQCGQPAGIHRRPGRVHRPRPTSRPPGGGADGADQPRLHQRERAHRRAHRAALVTEGALVGQGEATQLAVVQQIDPLYVNLRRAPTRCCACAPRIASWRHSRAPGLPARWR